MMSRTTSHRLAGSAVFLLLSSAAPAQDGVNAGTDGLTLTAGHGAFELTLGGRVHFDAINYDDGADEVAQTGVRRSRLELSGKIADLIRFRIDREFAGTDGWRNLWASIEPVDGVAIKGGSFSIPFAMEDLQSSNHSALMERSLATALTPGIGVGGGVQVWRRHWTLAAGYFGDALANEDGRAEERGKGYAGRITLAPVNDKGVLVHFGAAVERRSFSTGEVARFQANPGSVLAPDLLTTGRITGIDHLANTGGELALARGPLALQGQYVATVLTRTDKPTLHFDGWFAQTSWLVTGGRYRYSRQAGIITGADLEPSKHTIELTARYSVLDLNDGAFTRGEGSALTFGCNWYLNGNVRAMANYSRSRRQDSAGRLDREVDLFGARVQVSF